MPAKPATRARRVHPPLAAFQARTARQRRGLLPIPAYQKDRPSGAMVWVRSCPRSPRLHVPIHSIPRNRLGRFQASGVPLNCTEASSVACGVDHNVASENRSLLGGPCSISLVLHSGMRHDDAGARHPTPRRISNRLALIRQTPCRYRALGVNPNDQEY